MGVRILEDKESGECALYCSVVGQAFGPVMSDEENARRFLAWLVVDPRPMSEQGLRDAWFDYLRFMDRPLEERHEQGRCKLIKDDECALCDASEEENS